METNKFEQRTGVDINECNHDFSGEVICPICWKSDEVIKASDDTYRCGRCNMIFDN